MVERAEALLRPLMPASVDARLRRVQRIVERIERDRSILRVGDIAEREGTSPRALQLLFRDWVGVPPKWVIGHYRLQEAADRIERGTFGTLAELAQALGYFDQAHFAREFKAIVGVAPSRYARSSRSAGGEASRLSKPRSALLVGLWLAYRPA
ncbi:MAG: AraC family transcriptional regulator [Polyangiaceae bacterium]